MTTQPVVAGWSTPEDTDNGFVNAYADADIICHKGATNAQTSATVKAGGTVDIQWTAVSHTLNHIRSLSIDQYV